MSNNFENRKIEYLKKADFSLWAQQIFDILADNMTVIAPTGNTREEDFAMWYGAVSNGLNKEERHIILIKENENLIGFFQYCINTDTFKMEEIQFKPEHQGKGIFRELYGFILKNIKTDLEFVEAYASIQNQKSMGILEKLGLAKTELNANGRSYRFVGRFADLVKWYGCGQ